VIVVDSSVIAAFVLKEHGWERLADTLKNALTVDHAVKEVSNAVLKACRRGEISKEDAVLKLRALTKLLEKNVMLASEEKLVAEALKAALESSSLSVYDALFIALAREKGLPLVTLDEAQHAEALKNGVPARLAIL